MEVRDAFVGFAPCLCVGRCESVASFLSLSLYPCACVCVCARCVFFHLCFWRWLLLPRLALVIRSQDEVGWSGPACFAFGWVVGCVCGRVAAKAKFITSRRVLSRPRLVLRWLAELSVPIGKCSPGFRHRWLVRKHDRPVVDFDWFMICSLRNLWSKGVSWLRHFLSWFGSWAIEGLDSSLP